MKLSEMPYVRPDMGKLESLFTTLTNDFKVAESSEAQIGVIDQINDLRNDFETNAVLASIRYSADTASESNQEEKSFFDSNQPVFDNLVNDYYIALTSSKYRVALEAHFGVQLFDFATCLVKTISGDIVADLTKENELMSEYTKLLASAKIPFQGEEYNLSGMIPFEAHPDRTVRIGAVQALDKFMADNGEELDRLFDELVALRNTIAKKQGFENFTQMGYARMTRTDYDADMVASYRKQILEHVVPLATKLRELQKERIGVDDFFYHDEEHKFNSGSPKPQGTPEWIQDQASVMYKEMAPETDTFFQYMRDNELMDLVNRKGKAGGGYCTFLPNTKSPFIFSNFNGTLGDITVLTHEAGHAFQVYESRDYRIPEYNWPTYEACEIHSMSMEFLTWPWMGMFFKQDLEKFKYEHVMTSMTFLPRGVAVDEFQHFVYDNPEATPAERKAKWKQLEELYMPHRKYEGSPHSESGGFWQYQRHIYLSPFYYIDYTLALICAFQFWMKSEEDAEKAWVDYLRLCKAGGTQSFLKLVELAGLESPFADGCLEKVTGKVSEWLNDFDASALD
jgi:M3 family oligoendopeptidase